MKKVRAVSLLLLLIALSVMAVNWFAAPLPDWAVRITGMVMMLAIVCVVYSIVRGSIEK